MGIPRDNCSSVCKRFYGLNYIGNTILGAIVGTNRPCVNALASIDFSLPVQTCMDPCRVLSKQEIRPAPSAPLMDCQFRKHSLH